MKWVTIRKASELIGYSEDAVRSKIKRGEWREGALWQKAPDGRVLINTEAFIEWVEKGACARGRRVA